MVGEGGSGGISVVVIAELNGSTHQKSLYLIETENQFIVRHEMTKVVRDLVERLRSRNNYTENLI